MPTLTNLRDHRFGRLLVVAYAGPGSNGASWRCRCDCGNETTVLGQSLRRSRTRSCGCGMHDSRPHTLAARAKISANHRRHQSDTTRAKIAAALSGKPKTDAHRRALSDAKRGERCYRWKGGISNPRTFGVMQQWARAVKKRDNYTCGKCGHHDVSRKMHAHHIASFEEHPALRAVIDNGLTLCSSCHADTHRLLALD